MSSKDSGSTDMYVGFVFIGITVPHMFGWLGYAFVLLCYKLRDLTSHRNGPSRTTTFHAGMQTTNFEYALLAMSVFFTVGMFLCVMVSESSKRNKVKTTDTDILMDGTSSAKSKANIDIEAQNGEGSKPPPYTSAGIASGTDAPLITPDGDDMAISFSGWRVVIKKT